MENIGTMSKRLIPDLSKYQELGWDMYDDTYSVELRKDNWLISVDTRIYIHIYEIVLFYNEKGIWSIAIPFDRWTILKDKIFDILFRLIDIHQEIQ